MATPAKAVRGGIDLGGTKIEAIVVDGRNNVLGSARRPTPADGGPSTVAAEMLAAVTEAAKQAGVETRALGRGGAGEIGHTVVKINGARCPCGRRGCLEAYAGRAAMEARARKQHEKGHKTELFKIMKERGRTRLTSAVWSHALDHGDKLARELIDTAVEAIGAGAASAVNLLDVEAVIIGGGLGVRFGQPYADRIAHAMQPHLFADERP